MGDFAWRPFLKQDELVGGTVPPSMVPPTIGEGGQPSGEVGPVVGIVEVTPNAPSSVLAKRNQDDDVGVSGHKKSGPP